MSAGSRFQPHRRQMDKYQAELSHWQHRFAEFATAADYLAEREANYEWHAMRFPEIEAETGLGLDVGCGLVSHLEFAGVEAIAVDPLLERYDEIYPLQGERIFYQHGYQDDGLIPFPDAHFDFVWCVNVIDHTAHQNDLLDEIWRVLKPGGHFYFHVNFDPTLDPPHHVSLWDRNVVAMMLRKFFLVRGQQEWIEQYQKYMYWGLYKK